ncbi:FKBP65 [Symbiodinium sp. CCMP2456]|nr:FKBP65 [Symbiodinium sp. CCMP2456]
MQCSYVEAVAKEEYGQLPAWFVGHTWHEPFVDFVRRTMKHGTLGAGDAFWSFAFSTRWHECREMLVDRCSSVECLRTIKSLRVCLAGCTKTSTAEDLQQGRLPSNGEPSVQSCNCPACGTAMQRVSLREPPSSMRAAFIGIFLTRKGRSKGFFRHVYKAVKDENDMVSSGQELKDISTSFDSGDILGDGSVMKSIVEEGMDPAVFPVFGDDCVTHFVGTLPDGSIFNDTTKRDQPFKFRLGAEHVLEGFDEGVATMRKGERAIFQLSSEVAYGSFGARDERGWQVPPDTPVTFDIRLLDVIKAPANSATAQDPVPGYGREDVGSGGASPDGRYWWKRNGAEVLVMVPVADDVETKDVSYVFQEAYICIAVCGATLLAGRPGCDVEAEECYWEFSSDSGQRCLCVHLQKKGSLSARWPDALFVGTT